MNSIVPGTMKKNAKKKTINFELARPIPVKYRITFLDYELQQRKLRKEKKTLVDKEYELWFGDGSRKARSLASLQRIQRAAGIPDVEFLHPLDPRRAGV